MISIIFTVLFAILIAIFAVQNRNFVDIRFGSYLLSGVPLYLVVLITILLTLIFSAILYFINSVFTSIAFWGRERSFKKHENEERRENEMLEKRVHDLEAENARLKEQKESVVRRPVFSS